MLRALVVENDKGIADDLKEYMEDPPPGISILQFDSVDVAYSCQVAIRLAGSGVNYDLIIYDLELPWREHDKPLHESGMRLVQEIGPLQPSACGILVSGYTDHEYATLMDRIGAVRRLIRKPTSFEDILLIAQEAILEAARTTFEKLSASYHLQARVHEAMNGLNNILAAVSEIERISSPQGEFLASRSLPLIREEAENIRRFQKAAEASLRDLNPEEVARREPCDLRQIAEWCVSYLRSKYRKDENGLRLEVQGLISVTLGIREELQQMILILATNALQAIQESGWVKISMHFDSETSEIEIGVLDNGRGIPADIRARIFERGVSGTNGSGEGLFLARAFAWNHGGRIQVESPDSGGTQVIVRLPLRGVRASE
jgi:signal transduction histidine kinase